MMKIKSVCSLAALSLAVCAFSGQANAKTYYAYCSVLQSSNDGRLHYVLSNVFTLPNGEVYGVAVENSFTSFVSARYGSIKGSTTCQMPHADRQRIEDLRNDEITDIRRPRNLQVGFSVVNWSFHDY